MRLININRFSMYLKRGNSILPDSGDITVVSVLQHLAAHPEEIRRKKWG